MERDCITIERVKRADDGRIAVTLFVVAADEREALQKVGFAAGDDHIRALSDKIEGLIYDSQRFYKHGANRAAQGYQILSTAVRELDLAPHIGREAADAEWQAAFDRASARFAADEAQGVV